ncbi:MAG TPA: polymorphic toxin-type HINT domain-containing protein [Lacipirellulaceae bacterium]|jgi:hypothetical protein|nr:polymorphic toxin-type HINT domain-containing protein [Lacipirellulaceae bacterium]
MIASDFARSLCGCASFPRFAICLAVWCVAALSAANVCVAVDTSKSESDRLVREAASAEVNGDPARAQQILESAVKADPDGELAHWQLGQVQQAGKWMSVRQAQQRATTDPRQTEYFRRRDIAGRNVREQIALARWCRDNQLDDEADLHWSLVLTLDPRNREARRAEDLLLSGGRLINRTALNEEKQRAQAMKEATKHWDPIVAKWRRAVFGRDLQAHDAALAEIRGIKGLDSIPTMEDVTLGHDALDTSSAEACAQMANAFLDALANDSAQAATDSLIRYAVWGASEKTRKAAIEKLKSRDRYDYIPQLLGGLSMPMDFSYEFATDPDGTMHYRQSLYREGATADWQYDGSQTITRNPPPVMSYALRRHVLDVNLAATEARRKSVPSLARSRAAAAQSAAGLASYVDGANEISDVINSRIMPVLESTTQHEPKSAKGWWDWWRNENEYYEKEHPVKKDSEARTNGNCDLTFNMSCFVAGTPVWTKTGLRSIENIQLGDFVLAQDVESGALTFKPVIERTVRPPSPIVHLTLENDEIFTTKGHLFWVPGSGWRMAKQLGDDAKIHGLSGPATVRSVDTCPDAKAYNLVVADYSTYFVGKEGILVHDNTPRTPTKSIIPGVQAD